MEPCGLASVVGNWTDQYQQRGLQNAACALARACLNVHGKGSRLVNDLIASAYSRLYFGEHLMRLHSDIGRSPSFEVDQ